MFNPHSVWTLLHELRPCERELLAIRQSGLLCSGHLVLRSKRVPSRSTLSG